MNRHSRTPIGQLVLGPDVRGTAGPRTSCPGPGGHVRGGTTCTMTSNKQGPYVSSKFSCQRCRSSDEYRICFCMIEKSIQNFIRSETIYQERVGFSKRFYSTANEELDQGPVW